ncbi:MAG: Hsp20/alpha crystallin family protein [Candidatus Nanoarchaeia archaeon]|nr:Hsp20/alpha crystallin family protein [Candidatus Nanoarchaeia archaeon]
MEENLFRRMDKLKKKAETEFRDFLEKPKMLALPTMHKQLQGFKEPLSDIKVKNNEIVARIELPGINKKDVLLNVGKDFIEVKAQKKEESKEEGRGFLMQERSYSGFFRRLPLPMPANPSKMESQFRDGILEIRMPKAEVKRIGKK